MSTEYEICLEVPITVRHAISKKGAAEWKESNLDVDGHSIRQKPVALTLFR